MTPEERLNQAESTAKKAPEEAQQAQTIEGVYQCKCATCREFFNGHKRAVVCPSCMRKRTEGLGFPWYALIPPLIGLCAGIYMGAKL